MRAKTAVLENLLRAVPPSRGIHPAAQTVLQILKAESALNTYTIHDSTLPAHRTAEIYRSRFLHLTRKGITNEGFLETVNSLEIYADSVRAISWETEHYIIICFATVALDKIVGCLLSQKTKESV